MADVNFDCPRCGQNLDAPEQMAGMTILCPSCKQEMAVPAVLAPPPPPPGPVSEEAVDALKGSTVRLELPPDFELPAEPKRRIITIKRAE